MTGPGAIHQKTPMSSLAPIARRVPAANVRPPLAVGHAGDRRPGRRAVVRLIGRRRSCVVEQPRVPGDAGAVVRALPEEPDFGAPAPCGLVGVRRAGESGHHWRPAVYLDAAMRRTAPAVGAVDGAYVEVPHAVGDAAVGPCRQRAVHRGVGLGRRRVVEGPRNPATRLAPPDADQVNDGSAEAYHTDSEACGEQASAEMDGAPASTRARRVTRGLHSPAPLRALTWKYHSPPAQTC